jgi:hypothetical protein
MSVLKKILQESKDQKRIIGIQMYGDDGKFWCGYIKEFNENLIQIQHFSESGMPDGLILEKIENIESIDTDDDYSLAFQYLIENQEKFKGSDSIPADCPDSEDWQYDFLKKYKGSDQVLALEFADDYSVYGRINDLDPEMIKIKTISKEGNPDGYSIHKVADITAIRLGSIEAVKRKILADWKKQRDERG